MRFQVAVLGWVDSRPMCCCQQQRKGQRAEGGTSQTRTANARDSRRKRTGRMKRTLDGNSSSILCVGRELEPRSSKLLLSHGNIDDHVQ